MLTHPLFCFIRSHELRTPLHSVLGLLSVLEDSANLTPSERESLTTIRNSGEDLQTVISNVLDISKIQAGGIVAESIPLDLRNRASPIIPRFRVNSDH